MRTKWHFSVHPIGMICLGVAAVMIPLERFSAALLAVLLHEGAHMLCIWLCHVKYCSVEWTPFGFVAQAERFSLLPAGRRALIAAAGVVSSAVAAVLCYPFAYSASFLRLLFQANAALFLINMLPVFPLDGGRILMALASALGFEVAIRKVLLVISYLCALLLTCLGLYGTLHGILNPTLLILGPYLAYAIRQSSLQYGAETAQMLEARSHGRVGAIYKADTWVSVGKPDPLMMMRIFRESAQKKFVLLHTIDPVTGEVSPCISEQQIIVKLVDQPEIGG